MRVFAKKKFEFKGPNGEIAFTVALGFSDLPDWVAKTPFFKLAKKAGDVEVMASVAKEAKKENELSNGGTGASDEGGADADDSVTGDDAGDEDAPV